MPPLLEGAFHFKVALSSPPTAVTLIGADGIVYFVFAALALSIPTKIIIVQASANNEIFRRLFIATPQSNF